MNYKHYYLAIFGLLLHAQLSFSMDELYNHLERDKELFPQLTTLYPNGYHVDSFSSEFPQEPNNRYYQSCSMPATPSTPFENSYSAMVPPTPDTPVTPTSLTPCSDQENQTAENYNKLTASASKLTSQQAKRNVVNKIIRDVQKRSQPSTCKTSVDQEKQKQQKKLRSTIKNISNQYRIDLTQQIKPMSQMDTRVTVEQIVPYASSSLNVPNQALAQVLPTLPVDSFVIVPAQSFHYSSYHQ